MYVYESGKENNESILFLHGGDVAGWMWEPQLQMLQDQYHCIVPDLPGYGRSNQQPWQSFADTAQQLKTIIEKYGKNGRVHLVGLSMGGHISLYLLSVASHLIDKVVLSGTAARPFPKSLQRTVKLLLPLYRFRWYWKIQARVRGYPGDAAAVYVENGLGIDTPSLHRMMAEIMVSPRPHNLEHVTNSILVSAAEKDQKMIHESQFELLKIFPNAQAVIAPDVHHGWSGENPELFTQMMLAWLQGATLPIELIPVEPLVTDQKPAFSN